MSRTRASREQPDQCTSSPSRSFGSNHVDFGGMMPPASEIAIRSSIVTGYIENATAAVPESTALLEAGGAAGAADEIDPLVGADVADAEQRLEDVPLQQRDVEPLARESSSGAAPDRSMAYQRPARYIATSPLRRGVAGALGDGESSLAARRGTPPAMRPARSLTVRL